MANIKFKVTKSSPKSFTITELDGKKREITLGNTKHKPFFKTVNNLLVPKHGMGETLELPEEALEVNEETGRWYVICDTSIEELQKQSVKADIAMKKAQMEQLRS